ncbi:MAG: zinc metallopeptidase, partial [Clostridia bacterium]|nr:zinc metallopeptidase [Clostridia bacterium]
MHNFYYLGDFSYYSTYIIFILPALLISLLAQAWVKSAFSKYSKRFSPLSGAEAARRVLELNGVHNVRIERISGSLTDHFDPTANVIRLSDDVYDSRTIAAVGVAAHEAGHAVQHATDYSPIKVRNAILPICNFGSRISFPLILIGLILGFSELAYIGIILFSTVLLFQSVTLPVEFNASRRAITVIRNYNLLPAERDVA